MAGTYKHTENISYSNNSGVITSGSRQILGDAEYNVTVTVPASTTNQEVDIAFLLPSGSVVAGTALGLQSLCIQNGQTGSSGACTLLTNSTGSPSDTKALAAGAALIWNNQHPEAVPFTAAVTKFFITTTTSPTTLVFGVLVNLIPGG